MSNVMDGEVYSVTEVQAVEGKALHSQIALLRAADADMPDLHMPASALKVGDRVRISLSKIDDAGTATGTATHGKTMPQRALHFLHHYDRKNQGDFLSGPYHYFDFPAYKQISWDTQIVGEKFTGVQKGDVLIMGGGIYFTSNKPRLQAVVNRLSLFVGWGIGLDERIPPTEFIPKYSLLGTRERQSEAIDNNKVFYVPCVSCMNPVFDTLDTIQSQDVALHVNGGFNERALMAKLPNCEPTTTVDTFERIIGNIASASCVVTNSYHGAYWGSLLGKKVVCIKTKVPKWGGLPGGIEFCEASEILQAIERAQPIPGAYLEECRSLNQEFYNMVWDRIDGLSA